MGQDDIADKNIAAQPIQESKPLPRPGRLPAGAQYKVADGIREYLAIFFKHKTTVITAFFTIIAVSSIGLYLFYTPKYQARSLLLVKFGWENYNPDLSFTTDNKRMPSTNQAEIVQSEVRILRSRDLIERTVNALKPESLFPGLGETPLPGITNTQAAIANIEKDLVVTPGRGNIVDVTLKGDNPVMISSFVNQLVNFYIEKRGEIFKDPKSILFLQKKVDEYSAKLTEAENRLNTFKNEAQIVSFDDQRKLLLTQHTHLVGDLNACETLQKEIGQKLAEYDRQMSVIPEKVNEAGHGLALRITGTEAKLLSLQLHERELLSRYKEDNKLIIGVREQIAITTRYLDAQSKLKPAEMPNPVWQKIQQEQLTAKAELQAQKQRGTELAEQVQKLGANLQALEDRELKHSELVREVASNDEKLRSYRQRLEEARIQDELERQKMTSVSVVERASPDGIPVNPFRLAIIIPAIIGGAFIGSLGLGYLVEMGMHGVSTPAQAEKRLELPVLVAIRVK